jgi:hypothetical protein
MNYCKGLNEINSLIDIVQEYSKSWNNVGKEYINKYFFSYDDIEDHKTIDIDWIKVLQCFNFAIDFIEQDESTYYYLALIHYGNMFIDDKEINKDKILGYSRRSIGTTFGLCLHLSILYNWMHTNESYEDELNSLFKKYNIIEKLKEASCVDIFPFYADLCIHYNNGNSKITRKYFNMVDKWNIDFGKIYDTLLPFAMRGDPYIQFALGHISYRKTNTIDHNGDEYGAVWRYTRMKQGWKIDDSYCDSDDLGATAWSKKGLSPFQLDLDS